jgi:uncharacterized membrane protein
MAIGPVQLVVLGFVEPDFRGEVISELEKLRENDAVRVIDAVGVYKHADGEIEIKHLSTLTPDQAVEFGATVGALVGLGVAGEEGAMEGAELGAEMAADGMDVFEGADQWDVIEDIPPNTAAALILLEHHWAVGVRDAVVRAGGFGIGESFISPIDLVAVGLLSAEEAQELQPQPTAAS